MAPAGPPGSAYSFPQLPSYQELKIPGEHLDFRTARLWPFFLLLSWAGVYYQRLSTTYCVICKEKNDHLPVFYRADGDNPLTLEWYQVTEVIPPYEYLFQHSVSEHQGPLPMGFIPTAVLTWGFCHRQFQGLRFDLV